MLMSGDRKDVLIVREQPDLMLEISQLDNDEGIAEIVWSMAVYDFNEQKISMTSMDYSAAAVHLLELCKFHSDAVGLEGAWHILAAFSPVGVSDLDLENFQSPNTQVQILIDNELRATPLTLNFNAMGNPVQSI